MEFRSQAGQDEWVCKMFNYKRSGYFVDIGAYDGVHLSNSYYLEKELGWTGICVEPGKSEFKGLVKSRNCICKNMAIYSEEKTVELTSEGLTRGIKLCYQGEIMPGKEQFAETVTMTTLLIDNNAPGLIDYVSIDTEGSEYEILCGFPFDRYEVSVWTIEHNAYLDKGKLKEKIRRVMINNGYLVVSNGSEGIDFEDWFVHRKMINLCS